MNPRALIILNMDSRESFLEAALNHVLAAQSEATVLQILTSPLYHYGHNDLLASGRAKADFLLHIRQEVIEKGKKQAARVLECAGSLGLCVHLVPVETENPAGDVVAEARKGYHLVILPREPKRVFPLLHRTLLQELQRNVQCELIEL
jgi:hypothetical protein